eukprot:GHVL01006418.1.p1 GENE.GHVL01006418.1~~GHVL01006418.1.p1  ORF type:complete len:716 (+),score=146.14 GHVL01006418.1:35-2149(+)
MSALCKPKFRMSCVEDTLQLENYVNIPPADTFHAIFLNSIIFSDFLLFIIKEEKIYKENITNHGCWVPIGDISYISPQSKDNLLSLFILDEIHTFKNKSKMLSKDDTYISVHDIYRKYLHGKKVPLKITLSMFDTIYVDKKDSLIPWWSSYIEFDIEKLLKTQGCQCLDTLTSRRPGYKADQALRRYTETDPVDTECRNKILTVTLMMGQYLGLITSSLIRRVRALVIDDKHSSRPADNSYPLINYPVKSQQMVERQYFVPEVLDGFGFKLTDLAPEMFAEIRECFGISEQSYANSLCRTDLSYIEFESNSRSRKDQLFFFSHDSKYLIKTINTKECNKLVRMLSQYRTHFSNHPKSLLTKFLGLHFIEVVKPKTKQKPDIGANRLCFAVMSSVFDTHVGIHESFDLKGCLNNRHSSSTDQVKKDCEWLESGRRLFLSRPDQQLFVSAYQEDVAFLADADVMDYSLLVGIHDSSRLALGDAGVIARSNTAHLAKSNSAQVATPEAVEPLTEPPLESSVNKECKEWERYSWNDFESVNIEEDDIKLFSKLISESSSEELFDITSIYHGTFRDVEEMKKKKNETYLKKCETVSLKETVPVVTDEMEDTFEEVYKLPSHYETILEQNRLLCQLCPLTSEHGVEIYFLGLIDFLTVYDASKKFEHSLKKVKCQGNSISCVAPREYALRQKKFVVDEVMLFKTMSSGII